MMASTVHIAGADGYLLGNFLLSLGGTFLLLPSLQLCNAFPQHSGVILAMMTCAFDASAAVFLFYHLAWSASGGRFTPAQFFLGYLVVPLVIFVGEWTIMPGQPHDTASELEGRPEKTQEPICQVLDSDEEISGDGNLSRSRDNGADNLGVKVNHVERVEACEREQPERTQRQDNHQAPTGVWEVLHSLTAWEQMMTPWFILLLLATALQMLRMNYFIATVRGQYDYMLDSEEDAATINNFFDAALPLAGVATTPVIALILNNFSVAAVLAILTSYMTTIGVLNCLPTMWAGFATVLSFVTFRPFYYSAVS